jgi:hypothetical protein
LVIVIEENSGGKLFVLDLNLRANFRKYLTLS